MQTNKEALREFTGGVLTVLGAVLGFLLIAALLSVGSQTPDNSRFEVVDKYNECRIIRYTPEGSSRYFYFMDCSGAEGG